MPILIAPTAGHGLAHPEAECATARAAKSCGTLLVASTQSTRSLEEIVQAAQGLCWFQLYVESAQQAEHLVKRAEAAEYRALVLTVDTPQRGNRERDLRNQLGNWLQAEAPLAASGNATPAPESSSKAEALSSRDLLTWLVSMCCEQRASIGGKTSSLFPDLTKLLECPIILLNLHSPK